MVIGILFRIISFIGSFPVYLLAAFFFYFGTPLFLQLIIAFLISSTVIWLLRLVFTGKRPDVHSFEGAIASKYGRGVARKFIEHYKEIESRSFASSHVARVISFGYILYIADSDVNTAIMFLGLALLVGYSRLYLKRHKMFDLIIGAIIGAAAGYLAVNLQTIFF